jgi:hypothetical protein
VKRIWSALFKRLPVASAVCYLGLPAGARLERAAHAKAQIQGRTVGTLHAREDDASGWGQAYTIVRALPAEDGEYRYRIKSVYEPYERIARESVLSALQE